MNQANRLSCSGSAWGGTPEGGRLKFGTFVELPDVMNLASFHLNQMAGFWTSGGGGEKEVLPLNYGSYNIALCYRAAWQVI
jgi:hypothetical protein